MTSQSRRKHPITAPITHKKAKQTDRSDRWLACGLVLVFAFSFGERGALAEETNPPASFYIDDQARPILEATSSRLQTPVQSRPFTANWSEVTQRQVVRQPENWRLRWRESETGSTAQRPATRQSPRQSLAAGRDRLAGRDTKVRPSQFSAPLQLDQARPRRSEPSILFETQDVPSDPFNDPFGDRDLPSSTERSSSSSAFAEVPQSTSTSEPVRSGSQGAPVDSLQPRLNPMPVPNRPTSITYDPAPAPPISAEEPCDRVYNRRDCCQDGRSCDKHRRRVRDSPLNSISLNITPRMTVTQLDPLSYEKERQNVMRRLRPRAWRNDAGDVLAEGRMTDFKHGRIEVQTEDGLKAVSFADLCDDDMCFVTAWWSIPSECSLGNDPVVDRNFVASTMTWKASSLCHKPLYFEDVNLERYGHSSGPLLQPVLSGAHFFMSVAALPYTMGINPPTECRYPLGYYRPGDCAPWLVRPVPLSIRGGLSAAAAYVGGAAIIP